MDTLNIAGYRFVALEELVSLQGRIRAMCAAHGIRGTVLLAPEGINFFIAGPVPAIAAFRALLESDSRLAGIDLKESRSAEIPFRRLQVRIKHEIIALGDPSINPASDPAPPLEPSRLKSWLDAGREVILLDTRNEFEVGVGAFEGAIHLGNTSFRAFGNAAKKLPIDAAGRAIVTYCTGGIPC